MFFLKYDSLDKDSTMKTFVKIAVPNKVPTLRLFFLSYFYSPYPFIWYIFHPPTLIFLFLILTQMVIKPPPPERDPFSEIVNPVPSIIFFNFQRSVQTL